MICIRDFGNGYKKIGGVEPPIQSHDLFLPRIPMGGVGSRIKSVKPSDVEVFVKALPASPLPQAVTCEGDA